MTEAPGYCGVAAKSLQSVLDGVGWDLDDFHV